MTRPDCIDQLALLIARVRVSHPTRVAIDGVDGAGKTTLANELVNPLTRIGRQVIRATVDGFHRPREHRHRRGNQQAEGYFLDSFDYSAVRSELLEPLGSHGNRMFRRAVFDYQSDQPVCAIPEIAADDAILLFDGVFLQREELVDLWDLRVWVDAPFDVTVPRAVRRDAAGKDTVPVDAVYRSRYVPGQMIYLMQVDPQSAADVIVDNADFDSPELRFKKAD